MSAARTVHAGFTAQDNVRVAAASYGTLNNGYQAASGGNPIKARDLSFLENLTLDKSITVVLEGGYAAGFFSRSGYTTLDGRLTVAQGSLVADMLIIK